MKKSPTAKFFSESLAERLRERILRGELPPGAQLRQDKVAQEFGTSHIPVREAFAQLEARGFVTIIANRGAFVSAMTRDEALRSWTIEGAYAAFEENKKGSLEPGKMADFVMLSGDVMTMPVADIWKTQVTMTVVGGKIVHRQ